MPKHSHIDFVFDNLPGHHGTRLIEVETPDGKSISIGGWIVRQDGYDVLRITGQQFADALEATGDAAGASVSQGK